MKSLQKVLNFFFLREAQGSVVSLGRPLAPEGGWKSFGSPGGTAGPGFSCGNTPHGLFPPRAACGRALVPLQAGQVCPGSGVWGGRWRLATTSLLARLAPRRLHPSRRHKMAACPAPAGLRFPACPAPPREMAAGRNYNSRRAARRGPGGRKDCSSRHAARRLSARAAGRPAAPGRRCFRGRRGRRL